MTKSLNFKHISIHEKPEQSPGFLLWHVSLYWRMLIEKTLKQFGLTHPQFVVLATTAWLTKDETIVSQIEISRTAGLDPNTLSQIIRGLEKKNLIKRKQTIDERGKNPSLTAQGIKVLKEALPAVEKTDKYFFSTLTSKQVSELVLFFQKLINKDESNFK